MLLVLLALAAAASYIYWQRQARFLERDLAVAIERFNRDVKAQTGITPIEYEGFKLQGFPFSISLTLHNPILRLPLSYWIRNAAPNINWVEELRFTGDVTLSADWKVTRYALRIPTTVRSVSYINGSPQFARHSTASSPLECSLALNMAEAFDKLWQPLETLKLAFENIALLRDISCNVSDYRLTAENNDKALFQQLGSARFSLALDNRDEEGNVGLSLMLLLDKYHAYPLNDQYYHTLFSAFPELDSRTKKGLVSLESFSLYGEQNVSLRANYTGPAHMPDWSSKLKLEVPQLDISNALYNAKATIHVINNAADATRHEVAFDIDSTSNITPTYEQMAKQRFESQLRMVPVRIGIGSFLVDTSLLPTNRLQEFVTDIFPKLSALNPLQIKAKGRAIYMLPAQPGTYPSPIEVKLEAMDIKNSTWQMALDGQGNYAKERLLPNFEINLKVQNGDLFFAQTANKLIMFEKWRQLQRIRPPVLITAPYLVDLKRFVDVVAKGQRESLSAEVKTLGNPTFHIVFQNFLPGINGLGMNDIMLLFNELLLPHFSNTSPYVHPPSTYQTLRPRS